MNNQPNPITMESLWVAIQGFSVKLDTIGETLSGKLNLVEIKLDNVHTHVSDLETRVSAAEDNARDYLERITKLEEDVEFLQTERENSENRDRVMNLRFANIEEGTEGRDVAYFISKLITEQLGCENFREPLNITKAHRTGLLENQEGERTGTRRKRRGGAELPKQRERNDDRPRHRHILVKFARYQDRAKILSLVREKDQLLHGDKRFYIYPDYSYKMHEKRMKFLPVKKKLSELGINYALRGSTLEVRMEGKLRKCTCHKEAEAVFINPPSADSSMDKG